MNITNMEINTENYIQTFKTSISQRPNFVNTDKEFAYSRVCAQVLGCLSDKEDYFILLYELVHSSEKIRLLSGKLDRTLDNDIFVFLQKLFQLNVDENGLTVNRFIAFLEGNNLVPEGAGIYTKPFIREKLKMLLQYFKDKNGDFLHSDFRRVLVDIIKWQKNYIEKWLSEDGNVQKVVWYGKLSMSEEYFLHYMNLLGFDILYFNPEANPLELDIKKIELPSQTKLVEFPTERPVKKTTVAYNASKEIEKILHNEDSMIYKPWQLRAYMPQAVVLKTTYDEIFILEKELAYIRQGFQVKEQRVYIPSLFAKVSGISSDTKEYWKYFNQIKSHEQTILYTQFPITKEATGNPHFHFQNSLGADELLDPLKIIDLVVWRYKEIPLDLQKGIASAISRCIKIMPLKTTEDEYKTKLYLFNQFLNLPDKILKLLQQFDYPQFIPKILIFNSGKAGNLSRSDSALLLFCSTFGMDIIIYNPTGQNDIELYIKEDYYDTHWLEKVSFKEEIKEESLLDKFFKILT